MESGQWSPERSSDTQGGALLCGTESPERSPSPALSTGPASQSLEERQPRQEPRSVGWQPPESQGVPSQGQGERPRGASPGIPRVLVEQLLQMTLRPKLLSWPEVAWQPPCGGHRNPCPSFPEGTVTLQRQEELETTCAQLQRQVGEMERFLGDYGLQWVGEPMHEEDSEDGERDWMTAKKFWKPGDSLVPPEVDFDRLLASLKDLSELAVDSDTQQSPMPSRVPHGVLEPIPLELYRNGIVMFDGPFRPFHDPSTQRCLRDILDGFFPSELQRLYPDGVPFKVSDLRNQVYPENGLDPFPGEGRVVGWQRIRKPLDRMEHPGSRMIAEKFLNRLPKLVIRQGEVIDIRGPIRDTLKNCCPLRVQIQEIVVETPALAAERERSQESPESPVPALSTLRIKSENGEQAFLLLMRPEDTVGDVRTLLAQARAVEATTFEIFSTFPPTVYHNDALTLQAVGLVPNATLLLRARRAPLPAPGPE
ncbi:UBX domain-containing protein 11 isoform X2 [Neophocaena asiaeorientalis asiaeorientalis]|uniref:UBX domain-containing protein 11 n=1 Tax=Neophocaena asiaeorientalis asiaeorientalis TaxID=1706337 RepID=A0A341D742_NEOAA|nr:UBX domain-containing protein 11 isoform X2 [Neophocaena asiaeorientalis asiaeorientalis]